MSLIRFLSEYRGDIGPLIAQHLLVVVWALPIAASVGIGAGLLLLDRKLAAGVALGAAGVLTTIPSVAMFGLMIPILAPVGMGVGRPPAILALALYSILPILRNTLVGLREVPEPVIESARGMGMTPGAILWQVRLPLAAPAILAGVRTAVVMGIGVTAIAAYVGAGGLGRWVFAGIRESYPQMAAVGALLISALALGADLILAGLQAAARRRLGMKPWVGPTGTMPATREEMAR